MYSSQRMKDWSQILSLYQKNNIYLAEAASILQRNVQFEITALKKQINKCQQLQSVYILQYIYIFTIIYNIYFYNNKECEEKRISYGKSINEINIQIKQLCSELGIEVRI